MRAKIRLDTMKDINQFVAICSKVQAPVYITDGAGLKVSAKSVLGVMYSMEFADIWCECEEDIYSRIYTFTIIE
jgi:hypothetical protein